MRNRSVGRSIKIEKIIQLPCNDEGSWMMTTLQWEVEPHQRILTAEPKQSVQFAVDR
jgi:hypothetical protein